ncbi:MAG: replicative DNA helicase, partial [Microcystaceae cyanobacterium]
MVASLSLPPQNLEAEESILGGILLDPEALGRIIDLLVVDAFYVRAHREIYGAAVRLHQQGKPTDLMTMSSWLQDHHQLEAIGGLEKLAQLAERTVSAVNIDRYAALIMDKYLRRQLIAAGQEIMELGYDTTLELDKVLDEAEKKIFRLTQKRAQEGLVALSETLIRTFTELEKLYEKTSTPGVETEFYDLDAMTGGLQRSDLIILAGRPSMGKTGLGLNIAAKVAQKHRLPVAIFSLEMSKEQLALRLLAAEAEIDSNRLRTGHFSQTELEPLTLALANLSELPIYIDDSANITVMQMRSQVRRLQSEQKEPLGLVLIDYLQLMEGASDNRVQELSKITRSLKGLAREINAPVIALSQLSRAVESRTNKRPMMSDLRESGCLSGDSLVILADTGQRVAIKELVNQSNIKVWAINEKTMKLETAIASRVFATGIKPIFSLKTRLGRTIKATANHQFLTIEGWKRLDQLQTGSYIALPRYVKNPSSQSWISDKELALLGHLIGDGCTLPRHSIQYTTNELELAEMVVGLATDIFGDKIRPRIKQERQWYQVYLSANYHLTHQVKNPITEWLEKLKAFGLRSYEKMVPEEVFEQSELAIAVFLRHLWSTDGCIKLIKGKSLRPIAYYASSSEKLAKDVQSLLIRVGINARLSRISQAGKGRDNYHVTITGQGDLQLFIDKIGAIGNKKKKSLQEIQDYLNNHVANVNRDIIPHQVWQLYAIPAMKNFGITGREMQSKLGNSYCGTSLYRQNLSRFRAERLANILQSEPMKSLA